jgi:hypothetical protein
MLALLRLEDILSHGADSIMILDDTFSMGSLQKVKQKMFRATYSPAFSVLSKVGKKPIKYHYT